VYGHLSEWLSTKTEEDIERRYTMIGIRRAEQCVPVSQLLWCIVLVKENLWEYLKENENLENTAQIFGELELIQMVEQFFDRAMYYAVRGHERVREAGMTARK
jgi:isocitrate lyase